MTKYTNPYSETTNKIIINKFYKQNKLLLGHIYFPINIIIVS
jgi:hypothetical protein